MTNGRIASTFERVAALLEQQSASPFRVRAWREAARSIRGHDRELSDVFRDHGRAGLEAVPHIGARLAAVIIELIRTGTCGALERLQGDPVHRLAIIPGLGPQLAERIHRTLGIETLGSSRSPCTTDASRVSLALARAGSLRSVGFSRACSPDDLRELLGCLPRAASTSSSSSTSIERTARRRQQARCTRSLREGSIRTSRRGYPSFTQTATAGPSPRCSRTRSSRIVWDGRMTGS